MPMIKIQTACRKFTLSKIVEPGRKAQGLISTCFLCDCQGALPDRFRLRIFTQVVMETCQVIEAGSNRRMLDPKRFFSDGQSASDKRSRYSVLCALIQILPCLMQHSGSFQKFKTEFINRLGQTLGVRRQTTAQLPVGIL